MTAALLTLCADVAIGGRQVHDDAHVAARMMRRHKIGHVVVTHEQQVVGIVSSFDLLRLVEDHRFVMKNAPRASAPERCQS